MYVRFSNLRTRKLTDPNGKKHNFVCDSEQRVLNYYSRVFVIFLQSKYGFNNTMTSSKLFNHLATLVLLLYRLKSEDIRITSSYLYFMFFLVVLLN